MNELENLGGTLYGALVIAKRFKTRKCGHSKPVPAADCVHSLIGKHSIFKISWIEKQTCIWQYFSISSGQPYQV